MSDTDMRAMVVAATATRRTLQVLYLATDETSPSFFAPLRRHHTVIQFGDLFLRGPLRRVHFSPKLVGCIEQVSWSRCHGAGVMEQVS